MVSSALTDFSQMFGTYISHIVSAHPDLQKKLERYESKSNVWQLEVINTFRNRKSPVFTQESIIRLNQKNIHAIEAVNSTTQLSVASVSRSTFLSD